MNIRARIFARKITLVYFYELYFTHTAWSDDAMLKEIQRIADDIDPKNTQEINKDYASHVDLASVLIEAYQDTDKEIWYIVQEHFKKIPHKDIDFQYISQVAPEFFSYLLIVEEAVNTYATSFEFLDMDIMDRVIFVLGYIEFIKIGTPKEVIINEMVELAKRYWDSASPKLLNWIWHKVLSALETQSHDPKESL